MEPKPPAEAKGAEENADLRAKKDSDDPIANRKAEIENGAADDGGATQMAREVRRLRERMVEREIHDLLCDGKITPAQVGMARILLSSSECGGAAREPIEGLRRGMALSKAGESPDPAEVFREFLAAMPRGAAVDFSERTKGLRPSGGEHGLQASRATPEEQHEALARENLELVGVK